MITFAQFATVMDLLGSDMDNLAISSAVATDDLMVEVQTSSHDQAGSRPGTSMIETSVESGKDAQEVSTGNNVVSADGAVEVGMEVAEFKEYRYLHVRETTNIPVHCGPRPRIFVKGTKLDPIEYTFVNTIDLIKTMLDNILEWRTTGVSLFVDLEGKDLGSHHGDVRLMSIYHKLSRHTYLVGVSELGEAAFDTKSKDNLSLRDILESRSIVKGFWDVRNDAAGLYRDFGIKLNSSGVMDIQLVICKAKSFKHELNRPRLDEAIRMFCNMSNEVSSRMHMTKTAGKRMWNPAMGGSFAFFAERPLSPLITAYCINDTYFLEELLEYGMAGLSRDDLDGVRKFCTRQLGEIIQPGYRHSGGGKAINPFVKYGVDSDEYDD